MKTRFSVFLLILIVLATSSAHACPDIDGLVDLNCDQKLQIVAFGDSITYGRGDNQYLGGYPGRLEIMLPHADVINMGRGGEDTWQGRSRAAQQFPWYGDSDYFIILEGVNDYWARSHSAGVTKSNLLGMIRSAQSTGGITLLANLTAVRRTDQRSWVYNVNVQISPYRQIDFYSLGTGIISGDLLHPNGPGYQRMADLALSILRIASQTHRPVDSDHDGIYDFAEARFGTNPLVADTDGDGLLDGEEVFTYGSSPLLTDSDGDGFPDYYEVHTLHSNPADPRPTAPRLTNLEIIPPSNTVAAP
jgi:lysophospholipase L1-like esterase